MSVVVATDLIKDGDELFLNVNRNRLGNEAWNNLVQNNRIKDEAFVHNDPYLLMQNRDSKNYMEVFSFKMSMN